MTLKHEDGTVEEFERIVPVRCFPITSPNEFISIREPDTAQQTRGNEIGIIRYITDITEEDQTLINQELETRYFLPEILKVRSVKEKFGFYYWDSETTAGDIVFVVNNPFSNIRSLEDGSIYITDTEGNRFMIPDPKKLDTASYRKIEIYL